MTIPVRSAQERRQEIQEKAKALQIDEAYISMLVDRFYGRIREHTDLGPIFDRVIADNWDIHLNRMKIFWGSVALNSGQYSGKPVPKHKAINGLSEYHFDMWLKLFEETLKDTAPNAEIIPYFMERAERIAESLKLAIFGLPELRPR